MAPHSASRTPYLDTTDAPTAFLDWLPDATLILDNDGRIAAANDAARTLFAGERPPGVIGRRLASLCSGLAADLHLPYFRRDTTIRTFAVVVRDATMKARLQPFFDGQRHLLLVQPCLSTVGTIATSIGPCLNSPPATPPARTGHHPPPASAR